jgi:hypothetical protein
MASLAVEKGGVRDTKIETITAFVMRECGGDRELAVFMNAMQVKPHQRFEACTYAETERLLNKDQIRCKEAANGNAWGSQGGFEAWGGYEIKCAYFQRPARP